MVHTKPVGPEVKEIRQSNWQKAKVWPLSFYTSAQSPKVKCLQSTYMGTLFDSFGAKSLDSWQDFGHIENENLNFSFLNKILKY